MTEKGSVFSRQGKVGSLPKKTVIFFIIILDGVASTWGRKVSSRVGGSIFLGVGWHP